MAAAVVAEVAVVAPVVETLGPSLVADAAIGIAVVEVGD